jgi:hypothetical protein
MCTGTRQRFDSHVRRTRADSLVGDVARLLNARSRGALSERAVVLPAKWAGLLIFCTGRWLS